MWSITRRLKQSWTRWSLWKRALLLFVGICIAIQVLFLRNISRESRIRQRVKAGHLVLGPSPLPASVEAPLRSWVGPEKANLLTPVVEVSLASPSEADLAATAELGDLTTLEIRNGSLQAAGLKRLLASRQLTSLCLHDVDLDAESLSGLSDCARLSRIQIVGDVTPEALEALKSCKALRELYLGDGDRFEIKESSITYLHLAAISKIPHLKELVIATGEMSDIELRGLDTARELEILNVYDLRLQSDAIYNLGRLPRLQQLQLQPIDKHYPYEPRPLKGFLALKAFSIMNCRISSEFATSLAKLPKLEALSLSRCWVNDGLPGLAGASKLKLLDLAMTDTNSESFRRIGLMKSVESLRVPGYEDFDEVRGICPQLKSWQSINRGEYFSEPKWHRQQSKYGGGMGFF